MWLLRFILILFLSVSGFQAALCESPKELKVDSLVRYVERYKSFGLNYPREKVYLHLDNSHYFLGETIWFKAYVVNATRNSHSALSKVLYAELVTPEGYIVETSKLKIEDGQCHGNFRLRDSLALFAGYYEVRAYTRYMLNFDSSFIFSRVFPVYNRVSREGNYRRKMTPRPVDIPGKREQENPSETISLTFYPEGGHLVKGLKCRTAFKARGRNGEDIEVLGSVFDSRGDTIAEVMTFHNGMGSFEFTPGEGKYTARVSYEGEHYAFDLPTPLDEGYVIRVDNGKEETIGIELQKSPGSGEDTVGLCINSRGIPYLFVQIPGFETGKPVYINCSKAELPAGVNDLVLFNSNGDILSRRLVFVKTPPVASIQFSRDKPLYRPFEKITMDFEIKDAEGTPLETAFSVSVRDPETSSLYVQEDNILANFLLSSEIKGFVKEPGFYFSSDSEHTRKALDLLLMVLGWSRYLWEQMTSGDTFEPEHPLERNLTIAGRILDKSKKPDAGRRVGFRLTDGKLISREEGSGTTVTDGNGYLSIVAEDLHGEWALFIEPEFAGKAEKNFITLDRRFSPPLKVYDYEEASDGKLALMEIPDSLSFFGETPADTVFIPMDQRNNYLEAVEVRSSESSFRKFVKRLYEDAIFIVNVEQAINEARDKDEKEPETYSDLLYELGFEDFSNPKYIGEREDDFYSNYWSREDHSYIEKMECIFFLTPEIMDQLRGYPETDNSKYSILIKFMRGSHFGTERGTRKTKFNGYSPVAEFYQPDYSIALLPDEKDYRRTLYWNPNVKTDRDGKAQISFFNNGSSVTISVSAEMVTKEGIIGVLNN